MAAKRLNLGAVRALFLTQHHIDHLADVPVLMIDRWLLSSAAPLEVYGPQGSARLVSGTLRAFHPVQLAPVVNGGPANTPLSPTWLARHLPTRPHTTPLTPHAPHYI